MKTSVDTATFQCILSNYNDGQVPSPSAAAAPPQQQHSSHRPKMTPRVTYRSRSGSACLTDATQPGEGGGRVSDPPDTRSSWSSTQGRTASDRTPTPSSSPTPKSQLCDVVNSNDFNRCWSGPTGPTGLGTEMIEQFPSGQLTTRARREKTRQ